jgi:hypothetical protein
MRSLRTTLAACAFAALCFATTVYTTQRGMSQTGFLVPNVTVTAVLSTATIQVIGQNTARKGIQICNVGSTAAWIWPGATTISAYVLAPMAANVPVCYPSPSVNFGASGNAPGQAWSAEGIVGATTISVFEW